MANKMLIDAAHPEETRVVVLRGSRVEEFDFESANKKQLRGNIYLAKVTRVEPSLQAAFVDYGGNRHGFLAFSEIHPDYYQIPVSDRQALMEAEAQEEPEEEEIKRPKRSRRRRSGERHAAATQHNGDESVSEKAGHDPLDDAGPDDGPQTHTHYEEETRPVALEATETPPYDDPTAAMLEHAAAVHSETPTDSPDIATAPEPTVAADAEVDTGSSIEPEGEHHEVLASEESDDDEAEVEESTSGEAPSPRGRQRHSRRNKRHDVHSDDEGEEEHEEEHVEQLGGDAMEEIPARAYRARKQYKIQEVIKRRQVLLVQVVKEERGNKGAAITTYLSLAGRYSVLMPNTARGGGISRKITDAMDRQRLKSIAQELEVPDGMGVILRTAGASRSKPEVKRDFEYLMRMWETVRETTLGSQAPTLVYEEGSLIKRAIRDLYNKDVEEVVVAGEAGYREAKDFMRLLMPSHTKNVQPWRDPAPIFTKAGAEAQLDAMFSSQVTLKSGGYIVINQTEALVAIDVNSGRSTREHNIEDTAVRTNLEAADEVARQLRLRDLAGLIVVDFIDMEEGRNNRSVERRMKDALKNDRARIQIGRISHFGLLEMSRQRIRTGVLEGSTVVCEHCAGAGMVRSTSSIALHVLRVLEDGLIADASRDVTVRTRGEVALYILNQKRSHLSDLEARFGVCVTFEMDAHLTGTAYCAMERGEPASGIVQPARSFPVYEPEVDDVVEDEPVELDEDEETVEAETTDDPTAVGGDRAPREDGDGRRKRRRRRGRGRDRESSGIAEDAPQPADDALGFVTDMGALANAPAAGEEVEDGEEPEEETTEAGEGKPEGRRRRSRRGGRRNREREGREGGEPLGESLGESATESEAGPIGESSAMEMGASLAEAPTMEHAVVAEAPRHGEPEHHAPGSNGVEETASASDPVAAPHREATPVETVASEADPVETVHAKAPVEPAPTEPAPTRTAPVQTAPVETASGGHASVGTEADTPVTRAEEAPRRAEPVSSELDPAQPKRSGWWQRAKASLGG